MNLTEIAATAAAIVAALGGGGAIVLGLSNWFGKILADRYVERLKHEIQQELESYKTKLKKSEFFFQKEFEAVFSVRRPTSPILSTIPLSRHGVGRRVRRFCASLPGC